MDTHPEDESGGRAGAGRQAFFLLASLSATALGNRITHRNRSSQGELCTRLETPRAPQSPDLVHTRGLVPCTCTSLLTVGDGAQWSVSAQRSVRPADPRSEDPSSDHHRVGRPEAEALSQGHRAVCPRQDTLPLLVPPSEGACSANRLQNAQLARPARELPHLYHQRQAGRVILSDGLPGGPRHPGRKWPQVLSLA